MILETTYLSNRGYAILKTDKNKNLIKDLKKELTVSPKIIPTAGFNSPKEYPIYLESDNKLYMPKCFGLAKFGIPLNNNINDGLDCPNLVFTGSLRDNQKIFIEKYIESAKNPEKLGGIISAKCGVGKSIIAVYLACYFKKKTLFISHKDFLNEQFIATVNDFAPNAKIGKIKQKIIDVEGKDIVIATLQSLALRSYNQSVFKDFGLVMKKKH